VSDGPTDGGAGWFEKADRDDPESAREAIETRRAESPADWPERAIEAGFATDSEDYYDTLHEATVHAAREAVAEAERADDQQLIHSIRAMDDTDRTANELAERVSEWTGSRYGESGSGIEGARALAEREAESPADERLISLAARVVALDGEATELRGFVDRVARAVAPNLAALAGPVLAARLIALAGGLETLARKPSGTLQVLGAEEALFAHLRGQAPSPKHGVIYTHEYVRGTPSEHRGSAARALAGKLTIAARIDFYSGDRRPDLNEELDARIERIRARGEQGGGEP
jgi:nucleolar protein 56